MRQSGASWRVVFCLGRCCVRERAAYNDGMAADRIVNDPDAAYALPMDVTSPEDWEWVCRTCGATKLVSLFRMSNDSRRTGYKQPCLSCHREINRNRSNKASGWSSDAACVQAVLDRDWGGDKDAARCAYCPAKLNWEPPFTQPDSAQIEHVHPFSQSQTYLGDDINELDNLVLACRGCNSRKGSKTPEQAGMPIMHSCIGVPQRPEPQIRLMRP